MKSTGGANDSTVPDSATAVVTPANALKLRDVDIAIIAYTDLSDGTMTRAESRYKLRALPGRYQIWLRLYSSKMKTTFSPLPSGKTLITQTTKTQSTFPYLTADLLAGKTYEIFAHPNELNSENWEVMLWLRSSDGDIVTKKKFYAKPKR